MHCLIIVQNYPPEIGPVRYTYDLANSLNENGIKVTVITGIPHYPTGQKYLGFEKNKVTITVENRIEVIRTPLLLASNNQPIKRILGFITFLISALPHLIKKRKVDLIIVSIPPFTVLFLGILGKVLFRIPFIALLRDFEPYESFKVRNLVQNKFILAIVKVLSCFYYFANSIVATHSNQLNTINQLNKNFKNCNVITHSVSVDKFSFPVYDDKSEIKSKKCHLLGIYIGTFGKCHSLPKLIESLISPEIAKLPIDFIFIGDGEDKIECKMIAGGSANHNVKLLDSIPYENVPAVLQQADFLVYSIKTDMRLDGVGAKFYEYLASAKPILICGEGNATEIVKELENGWWVDSTDPHKLYACLQRILSEKTKLMQMGLKGRTYLIEKEKNNSFERKWINLCNSLIQ